VTSIVGWTSWLDLNLDVLYLGMGNVASVRKPRKPAGTPPQSYKLTDLATILKALVSPTPAARKPLNLRNLKYRRMPRATYAPGYISGRGQVGAFRLVITDGTMDLKNWKHISIFVNGHEAYLQRFEADVGTAQPIPASSSRLLPVPVPGHVGAWDIDVHASPRFPRDALKMIKAFVQEFRRLRRMS
jgi:hypothetical protein